MPRNVETHWVRSFKGYTDSFLPGESSVMTDDLNNVKTRFGRIFGRGGMTKWNSVSTASSAAIIGLFNYRRAAGTHRMVRLLPTAVEEYTSGWNVITGTALTGTTTSQPHSTIIDDTLIFTNGVDLPRKYSGTGNTSSIAAGSSPFAKGCISYLGFLFLTNVSDDGTFTDVFDGHRIARYSDDWDADWSLCANNEITLDETPGAWVASVVLGRNLYGIKTDGIVQIRFTGGQLRFQQELLTSDVGCVAPLSVAKSGNGGAFFLGTDGVIYLLTDQGIKPVSTDRLWNTLPTTFSLARLKWARGVVDSEDDTYYLFYDRTGLGTQLLDSYVSYNYLTGEIQKGTLGASVIACSEFKPTDQEAEAILLSTTTLVEEFDSGSDDDGAALTRTWTTGWQPMGRELSRLHGVRVLARKSGNARIKIDIATNYDPTFQFPQVFSLKGGAASDTRAEITYHIPPQLCEVANVRIRLYHDTATATSEIQAVGLEVSPSQFPGFMADRGQANKTL